jgi:hypothetical protein
VFVDIDKRVQFAIRNVIKDKSLCANVLRRFRQADADLGIALRGDNIALHFSFRLSYLSREKSTTKNDCGEWPEHTSPHDLPGLFR